jgi:DNA (cytosine-5)-methyltransferase 1
MNQNHKFPYKWYLADGYPAKGIEANGLNVFGTFICGGGSSMGYKLAGFNHLGGVEIDKQVADVYQTNHKPKYLFNEDIRLFNQRTDLPKELYELDILDGSPPCSTFSMAGSREKAWGKSKQFREGQAKQTLDDLVFVYCDTIIKLQPKVFILENVKGIIQGNAKVYSKAIVQKMTKAGYTVQVFMLNAASMGVPQKRERVFFIGFRAELGFAKLKLEFGERGIAFGEIENFSNEKKQLSNNQLEYYNWCKKNNEPDFGKYGELIKGKRNNFGHRLVFDSSVCDTIIGNCQLVTEKEPRYITNSEAQQIGTYPLDYNFKSIEPKYLIGMSVPPVMTAQIAHKIYEQWLKK